MKPYPLLTEDGKIRRLRALAEEALADYDVEAKRLTCVARRTHTTFRVETSDQGTFALRIGPGPDGGSLPVATEVAWLRKLDGHQSISAVRPVSNRRQDHVTRVRRSGVPGVRTCTLFEWIPGRPLGDAATRVDFVMLGELSAHLHEQARRWKRRRGLQPLVWDRVFYYPRESAVLYDGRFRKMMTPERVEVIRAVEERAGAELARLGRDVPSFLLHAGLHPANVMVHAGRLHVLGFDEVTRGAAVQDIAITLFHARRLDDYEGLLASFIAGYRSIREWPVEYEGQVLLLMAARHVMLINYVLRKGIAAEGFVASAVEEMAELL